MLYTSCLLARRYQTALLVVVVCPATSERLTSLSLGVLRDASLELWSEMANQSLDWPSESLAKSYDVYQYLCLFIYVMMWIENRLTTDSVTLDLLGELLHHVNLAGAGLTLLESVHDLLGPLATLTAWSALTARLVVVELAQTSDGADDIS